MTNLRSPYDRLSLQAAGVAFYVLFAVFQQLGQQPKSSAFWPTHVPSSNNAIAFVT